jgi:hypothetical protein
MKRKKRYQRARAARQRKREAKREEPKSPPLFVPNTWLTANTKL